MKNNVSSAVFQTLKKAPLLTLGVFLTVAGAVVASLLPPLVLAEIVDRLTEGSEFSFSLAVLYFVLIALTGILESLRETLLTMLGQKITHSLRSAMSRKLNRLSAGTLSGQEPGALVSRFIGDVDTVENLFSSGIVSMAADLVRILSILIIIFTKNKGLTLVLLMIIPFIFLFTRHVQKNTLKAHLLNRAAVSRVSNHVPETLKSIRTIRNLNKESYMEDNYDRYILESYSAVERTNFYDSIYSPVILILNALVVALVMTLSASGNAGILSLFGMSVGTAVAVINYISQIFSPIQSLGMEFQTIQSAVAGVKRINDFLVLPERWDTKQSFSGEEGLPALQVEGLSFGYDEKIILKDLDFSIGEGENVTLSGRTGAGKSTLFKLILGLYRPDAGSVKVFGQEAFLIPDGEKRKIFGYVEQNFHEVPGTILDQITLGDSKISREMAETAAKMALLHDTILKLEKGYDTPCSPEIFSQGQWQLLSIARAVAAQPKILLLDEITANLDADTERKVLEAISNVSKDRTVLSISHRIYTHTGGRLFEIGKPEQ